jgi:CubicO group peptidase (beta-lactamase class C family)
MNLLTRFQAFALASAVLMSATVAPALAQQPGPSGPDFAAIDRYVESERQAMRVPGLTIGIVQGERVVHTAGFGQADPSGRPVTAQTPFFTASLMKSFTALAVMQLVEAGQVDLDAPIQRYLPWFRVADADASARITVRHLLNQTSGFPTNPASAGMVGGEVGDQALERGVRSLASVSLSKPVGSTYQYSNFNYRTLGMLVQAVSGQSYEQYLQQHVLDPLDMQRSYTSQAAARANGLATGHRFWFGVPVHVDLTYSGNLVASGGLMSTSEDLAHYLVAQLNGGQYGRTSVLSSAGIAEQHRGAVSTNEGYYGMGWESSVIDGVPVVHHNGTLPNAYARLVLFPEQRTGIVVLANATSLVALPRLDALAIGVESMLGGRTPRPVTENRLFEGVAILSVAVVLFQILWLLRSVARMRQSARRPRGRRGLAWHVAMPLALNLAWATLILVGLPLAFGLSLGDTVFIVGDVGYLLAGSAAVALMWGVLQAVLTWRGLRTADSALPNPTAMLAPSNA